jgi:beta-lactamase regulating signal transducer with metallopeptidase domain
MTLIFFNILTNATFSLLVGFLVVGFFLWFFRIEPGPWKVFLLSLPFLKIVYDLVRGLPADSVLLSGIDPYTLPPKHQLLQVGAGFSEWGPIFNTVLSVKDIGGKEYASSVGDYLAIWVNRKFGPDMPLIIVSVVAAVALTLVAVRVLQAFRFEKRRRIDRTRAQTLRTTHVPLRSVDTYISEGFSGTPFTGGVLKPYICIPSDSKIKLSADEMEAVISHELGHICRLDLLVTICVQVLGDIFWFVPGYRWLAKKIDELRELVADEWAVERGIEPALLASALLKLKEIPETSDHFILYSAFLRKRSLLRTRVERLLGTYPNQPSRFGWRYRAVRYFASFWIFMAVMIATFGGNHSPAHINNPDWFNHLMNSLGLS